MCIYGSYIPNQLWEKEENSKMLLIYKRFTEEVPDILIEVVVQELEIKKGSKKG